MIGSEPSLPLIGALALILGGGATAWALAEAGVFDEAPEADYVAICAHTTTDTRVDDQHCPSDPHDTTILLGHAWFYLPTTGGHAPPIGQRFTRATGNYRAPSHQAGRAPVIARNAPAGGGAVTRGGFGVTSTGSGGS